ncbi:amino acid ABC transporter substrate-binding protein [Paenisporosarcina quisquiliarum]|uniref:Amino acid ABC transporter substrate-binding protein n=1 Tax=Paenisporosarcina quisquiliarum TaxID=365346 RepID=A0A9X3LJL9_9BACL|nr:amino acid ABC transporter substrate-binding protein [Paenisporosarcina quisquiliarum]MCZ8538221.1 amino acid ABC transporter substrate-binding protein [Paenisporosarcina quisquiliarum]
MKKLTTLFALLLTAVFMLSACGTSKDDNASKDEKNTGSTESDLLAKVQEDGELLVGTEGTYPPFTYHDESGKLTGFDVEIAEEIAARLGVKAKFMETQWDAMFAGLDSKRFDMIANQVGIKEERLVKYDFSEPYISSTAVLVTHADNKEVKSFEDLKGLKSGQSLTSNYAEIAKSYGAELVGVDGFNQAIELLNSQRVDATINDKLSVLDFQKQKPDAKIQIVAEADDVAQSGLMFRKGNETLVEAVNKALNEMIEDGTYDDISEKWFGENVLE